MRITSIIGSLLMAIFALGGFARGQVLAGSHVSSCSMMVKYTKTGMACCAHHSKCCSMVQPAGRCSCLYHIGVVDRARADKIVEHYHSELGNPNLKQGDMRETEQAYVIEVVTEDNSLAEKISIEKKTGYITVVY
jgi:hypothetical protein